MGTEISGERTLPDKITALKNLAKSFEMKMKGFKPDTTNDNWVISGEALAGGTTIDILSGMLYTFAENANLFTTKTPEKFLMEFTDGFYKASGIILNCQATPSETHRSVIKIYKDTFSNIGDIITGSKKTLSKIFENPDLLRPQEAEY